VRAYWTDIVGCACASDGKRPWSRWR